MREILSLLLLVSLVASVVAMISPRKLPWLRTRTRALLSFGATMLVAFLVADVPPRAPTPMPVGGSANSASTTETMATTPAKLGPVVTRAEFGDRWPFTVASGTLRCEVDGPRKYVTLDTGDGIHYALNGAAKSFGFPSADDIIRTSVLYSAAPLLTVPEPKRRQIFANLVGCEDAGKTSAACRAEASASTRLSTTDIDQIALEGGAHGWSPLTPVRMSTQPFIERGLTLCR